MRPPLLSVALLLFLACETLCWGAPQSEPVRLAVAGSPELLVLSDLITADLSTDAGLALVERAQMDKIAAELKIRSLGYAQTLSIGRQLGAQAVLVLGGMPSDSKKWEVWVRLVDARTGLILFSEAFSLPVASGKLQIKDAPAIAKRLATSVRLSKDRITATAGDLVPVSFLHLKSVFSGAGIRALDSTLNTLVVGLLEHHPSVCLLERQMLDLAAWEKNVNVEDASPFWTGRVVVSGAVETATTDQNQLVVRLKIDKSGGQLKTEPIQGSRDDLPGLARLIADAIALAAKPDGGTTPPVDFLAEAKRASEAAKRAAGRESDWRVASGLARSAWVFSSGDKKYLPLYLRSLGWQVSARCVPVQDSYGFHDIWIKEQVGANELALNQEPALLGSQFDAAIEAANLLVERRQDFGKDYIAILCEIHARATALLVAVSKRPDRKSFDAQRTELQASLSRLSDVVLGLELLGDGARSPETFLQNRMNWSEYLHANGKDWVAELKKILSLPPERFKFHYGGLLGYRWLLFQWPWVNRGAHGSPAREIELHWADDPKAEGRRAQEELTAWLPESPQPETRLIGAKLAAEKGKTDGLLALIEENIPAVAKSQVADNLIMQLVYILHDSGKITPAQSVILLNKTLLAFQEKTPARENERFLESLTRILSPDLPDADRRDLLIKYEDAAQKSGSKLIAKAKGIIPPVPGDQQPATVQREVPRLRLGKPDYAVADRTAVVSFASSRYSINNPQSVTGGGKFWFLEYPKLVLVGLWPGQATERIPLPEPRTPEEITWLGAVRTIAASSDWVVLSSLHNVGDWSLLVYDRRAKVWHRGTKFPAADFARNAVIDEGVLYFEASDPRRGKAEIDLLARVKLPAGPLEILTSRQKDVECITKNPPHDVMGPFDIRDGVLYLWMYEKSHALNLQTLEWTQMTREDHEKIFPPEAKKQEFQSARVDLDKLVKLKQGEDWSDQRTEVGLQFSGRDGSDLCLFTDPPASILFTTDDSVVFFWENRLWFVKRANLEANAVKLLPGQNPESQK